MRHQNLQCRNDVDALVGQRVLIVDSSNGMLLRDENAEQDVRKHNQIAYDQMRPQMIVGHGVVLRAGYQTLVNLTEPTESYVLRQNAMAFFGKAKSRLKELVARSPL